MEGYSLSRSLREIIGETSSGTFINDRTSYDYLMYAVQDFNRRTRYTTATTTISLTAAITTGEYALPVDFIDVALSDQYSRKFVKVTYGGNTQFIFNKDYASGSLEKRMGYSIVNATASANIIGTSAVGAYSNGECLLSASTSLTSANVGDFVHNTTQNTAGIITATPVGTTAYTALFTADGVAGGAWAASDAFIIVQQPQYKIKFTPAPTEAASCVVTYIQKQAPVYSPYRCYQLPFSYSLPLVQFAAFLYKCRDREPNYGDQFYKYYEQVVQTTINEMRLGDVNVPAEDKHMVRQAINAKAQRS